MTTPSEPRPAGLRFAPRLRLRDKADYEHVFATRCRVSDDLLTIWAASTDLPHPRLGLLVGKRHGDAVTRNRLKRLLREAFRLEQHDLPAGVDLVASPRPGAEVTLATLQHALRQLAARAIKRLRKRTDDPEQSPAAR